MYAYVYLFFNRRQVKKAKETKNYKKIKEFYFETFESFQNICATFKKDPNYSGAELEETGLKIELVYTVHDLLKGLVSSTSLPFLAFPLFFVFSTIRKLTLPSHSQVLGISVLHPSDSGDVTLRYSLNSVVTSGGIFPFLVTPCYIHCYNFCREI